MTVIDGGMAPDMEMSDVDGAVSMSDAGAVSMSDADSAPETCTVEFAVTLPEGTNDDSIYLAGNFCQNECGGGAGHAAIGSPTTRSSPN